MLMKKLNKMKHTILMYFWIANFPVAMILYFFTDEKILLLYTVLCSVYANVESSASAKEAKGE